MKTNESPTRRYGHGTLRELFRYNDWARDQLVGVCSDLSGAQLDRTFEMGMGTIRATMNHICAAERVWLDRWIGHPAPRFRMQADGVTIAQLADESRQIAAERDQYLQTLANDELERMLTYRNSRGQEFRNPIGGLVLHVCTHGIHHRAQVLNMLRHVGAALPKPGLDYIFMRLALADAPPPALDVATLRTFFEYSDWAMDRMLAAVQTLDDARLDRAFEMGVGTLRRTLLHIRFAEQWWLDNWTQGPGGALPELPDATGVDDLRRLTLETRAARNAFLARTPEADLASVIEAHPRPGVVRRFPLGVTMLQLCCHGMHHRAQALNMLRHVGAKLPTLDVVEKLREEQ